MVEGLQSNRSEPVQLLDQLLRQLPEGVYLKQVKQTGAKVNIVGYAQSNARVSTLMRNLGASPYLENPELVEIKAVPAPDKSGSRVNEFNMNISIKRAQADDARQGRRPRPGGQMNLIEELQAARPEAARKLAVAGQGGRVRAHLHRDRRSAPTSSSGRHRPMRSKRATRTSTSRRKRSSRRRSSP